MPKEKQLQTTVRRLLTYFKQDEEQAFFRTLVKELSDPTKWLPKLVNGSRIKQCKAFKKLNLILRLRCL